MPGMKTARWFQLRACFKIRRGPVFGQKAGWRDATSEHTRQRALRAAATEQRSQTAFCPKTRRAAGLLPVAGVGSFLTARCGDARNSPPWPRPKSLAAGLLLILKQALSAGFLITAFPAPGAEAALLRNAGFESALVQEDWEKTVYGAVYQIELDTQVARQGNQSLRVTREPLCAGQISPLQYGQFVEYLCDLVPAMWAEKLFDGSFEGLSPYKFVFLKETDFKEKPWHPSGAVNRTKYTLDRETKISGDVSQRIEIEAGAPATAGLSQDGIFV